MKTNGSDPVAFFAGGYIELKDVGYVKQETSIGLTKREYFAAMAMQGYLANQTSAWLVVAENCVKYADALIKELNKEEK